MKEIFVTKQMVEKNISKIPTPFHLYDEKGIRENARRLREAFSWNKGFKEYFAVKATPNPFILGILKACGCGCDCASLTELMLANAIGCTGSDIMFSSNDTPIEEYQRAKELGAIINFDDITHIELFEQKVGKFPETVCIRYNPGGVYQISNEIMDNPGESKYGMTKAQIFEAAKVLTKKGVKKIGIHAFLVSNALNNEYFPMLAKSLFELVVEVKKQIGVSISFVNLSGGIGVPYYPTEHEVDIELIGQKVKEIYDKVLGPEGFVDIPIYTELGRYMTAPYGCLVTTAIHEKHTYKEYIGVDACAVDLMRPAMYGAYHHITVLGKENSPCTKKYDITGSLCENNDKFAIDRMLPEIQIGDYLVIHDTGGHGYAMGYNYNGKLRSAEVLLKEDGSFSLIRRAETPKDYFSTFDCFPIYNNLLTKEKVRFR